jgi:hypothetical protein
MALWNFLLGGRITGIFMVLGRDPKYRYDIFPRGSFAHIRDRFHRYSVLPTVQQT